MSGDKVIVLSNKLRKFNITGVRDKSIIGSERRGSLILQVNNLACVLPRLTFNFGIEKLC